MCYRHLSRRCANQIDVLDTEEWNAIHSGMRMVVENTKEFDGFPIEAAGKTGTAQQNLKRPNHALFVGYAPYDDPEISIATRIAYGYTSHNAAKLARNVFAYYFNVENEDELLNGQAANGNLPPTETVIKRESADNESGSHYQKQ